MADDDPDWPGSLSEIADRLDRLRNVVAAYGLIYAQEEARDLSVRVRAIRDRDRKRG